VFAGVADQLPLKRVGTAEDCAHAVQYLIESPYSTGAVVDVDGGWR
jgi:NAD(P)-dependent dehydrogenase (short-subunit alcohol dehydrogenase family)